MIPIGLLLYAFADSRPIASNPAATLGLSIALHPRRRRRHRRGHRLHGRPDRRLEQSRLGRRHPLRARHRADPGRCCSAAARSRGDPGAGRFRTVRDRVIFGVATISNDNLQDLKTGQLVGATPWRQQFALVLGVIFGAHRHPADPRPVEQRLRLPGCAGRWPECARSAAGGADLAQSPKACSAPISTGT